MWRTRRIAISTLLLIPLSYVLLLIFTEPSTSRDWAHDQATLAHSRIDGHLLHVQNVRDFRYDSTGTATHHYYDATYDLDSVETAWFILTTFSKTYRAPAHTFVSFGFAGGRYLAISVEARREDGETYGIFAGMLRRYELVYVLGDERDLVGKRAVVEGDATYLYPVNAPRDKIRAMLVGMVSRANELQEMPEFYHSVLNSCTSNLVRHVNEVSPGRIPAGWKVLVPGYTDEVAMSLGLVRAGDPVAARRRFYINDRARAAMASDSFSVLIRQ